jgi:AcrR family transcriptional regulator
MTSDTTSDRIVLAALALFLQHGVKKTNLVEVAFQAGITRVTIYRYFRDKEGLVRAVCRWLGAIFQRAAEAGPADTMLEVDQRLSRLGTELSDLPPGDLLSCLDEINRLHPEVYREFCESRRAALDHMFHQALEAATREGVIREGLNFEVLHAMFLAAVAGLIENRELISSNVSLPEICATVTAVFRHGILKHLTEGNDS